MRAVTRTGDEVQVLADNFNVMAASLQRLELRARLRRGSTRKSEAGYRYLM